MEFCPYVKANNCSTCLEDGSCFAQAKHTVFNLKTRIRELEANLEKATRIIKRIRFVAWADRKVVEQFLSQFNKPKQTESETVNEICTLSDHLRKLAEQE